MINIFFTGFSHIKGDKGLEEDQLFLPQWEILDLTSTSSTTAAACAKLIGERAVCTEMASVSMRGNMGEIQIHVCCAPK